MSQTEAEEEEVAERSTGVVGLLVLAGLVIFLGVRGSWSAVVIVFALVLMIFLHELGHYLTAKWAGMKVTEFFIGFGPKLWSFQRGETEYGLKAIPAGAYVKVIGMSNLDEVDPADEGRTYRSKSYPRRMSVAVAGSTMHFILAFLLICGVFIGFGTQDDPTRVDAPRRERPGRRRRPAAGRPHRLGEREALLDVRPHV